MTKREAATILGVSVRTLERYTAQGKLCPQYVQAGKSRQAHYEDTEIAALKAQLHGAPRQLRSKRTKEEETETVSFRLDPLFHKRLSEAAFLRRMSAGEYARSIVLDVLSDAREDIFKEEIARIREDIAVSVEAMLAFAGTIEQEKAHAWVNKNLRRE